MSLETPVAVLIFNRPDLTKLVFQEIRKVKPKKILVVADGSRFPEEEEKCRNARQVFNKIDWECELLTNFSEVNLTSPIRCSSGIDWIFSNVEEAIILEDDCLPSESFFFFCQEMIERYREDERIMHISGSNFRRVPRKNDYSYCFSKYGTAWGWATWRRAWKYFDFEMKEWLSLRQTNWIETIHKDKIEQQHWIKVFDSCTLGGDPHWDYAWMFSCWSKGGLSIIPEVNLVSNTGCRWDGTRHSSVDDSLALVPRHTLQSLRHPEQIIQDTETNNYLFDIRFGGKYYPKNNPSHEEYREIFKSLIRLLPQRFRDQYRDNWIEIKTLLKIKYAQLKLTFLRPDFPCNQENKINLHLGCGTINHPRFINIDGLPFPHIHYVRSLDNLAPFKEGTVDLIYACHCLEHFSHTKVKKVLLEWFRPLKKDGILRISVPDFDSILAIYKGSGNNIDPILGMLMGGQGYKFDFHMTVFNQESLKKLLLETGFREVRYWQPGSDELTTFDDWSGRKAIIDGKEYPISLNLEAVK